MGRGGGAVVEELNRGRGGRLVVRLGAWEDDGGFLPMGRNGFMILPDLTSSYQHHEKQRGCAPTSCHQKRYHYCISSNRYPKIYSILIPILPKCFLAHYFQSLASISVSSLVHNSRNNLPCTHKPP